jgi:hypothetical protein
MERLAESASQKSSHRWEVKRTCCRVVYALTSGEGTIGASIGQQGNIQTMTHLWICPQ